MKTGSVNQERQAPPFASFDNVALGIVELGPDARIRNVNSRIAKLLGYQPHELLGMHIEELTAPQDRDLSLDLNGRLLRGELDTFEYEKRYVKKDGTPVWVRVTVSAMVDTSGGVAGAVGTVEDITERKRVEEELERERTLLQGVFDNMSEGLMLFDAQGNLVYQNPASLRIHGLDPEHARIEHEQLPATWNAWDEQGRPLGFGQWPVSRVFRNERFQGQVLHVQRIETGDEFDASYNGSPICDAQGTIIAGFITIHDITEKLRAERALKESEARFRDLADNIAQLAWMADAKGTFSWYNQRWYDYTGTTPVEMQGWGWQQVLHPEHADRVMEKIERCFKSGAIWEDTFPLRGKKGEYRWFLSRAVPIRDGRGQVVRWFGTNTDITELKRSEESLRASEEKFAKSFHGNSAAMAITRMRDGVYLDVNDRWVQVTGFTRKEVLGRASTEMIWRRAEDRQKYLRAFQKNGTVSNAEFRFAKKNGEEWTGLVSSQMTVVEGEQVIVTSVVDISDRKRMEAALRESEQKYSAIHDRAPLAISLTRFPEGTIVEVNDAFVQLFGYSRDEAVGKSNAELGLLEQSERRPLYAELAENGAVRNRHLTYRTKSGARRLCSVNINRVSLAGHDHLLAVLEDITEHKRAEQELRDANAQLREMDERKNEFLAMLSHELRNPLAPVRNSVYIINRAAPGGQQAQRALSVIDRQVTHMTRLIDDLLDVTRISRGKIRLQKERIELGDLVRRTAEDHRALFEHTGVDLDIDIGAAPVYVNADATRIAQVVGNLLVNGAKFTPSGGQVRLTLVPREESVEIQVQDNGAGIAPDLVGKLFEPFVQAEQTLDRSHGGLGLGLALVRGLVDLHGGWARVHSEGLGKGATFIASLPFDRPERTPLTPEPRAGTGEQARRVLIVEDNPDAAESLKEVLELGDHVVDIASTGPQGVSKARAFRPDLILCDIGLPGMDGFEVAKAVRSDPELQNTPMVALSGYTAPEDIEKSQAAGFDRHVAKPVDLAELERVLTELPARASAG